MVAPISFSGKMLLYECRDSVDIQADDAVYNALNRLNTMTKFIKQKCKERKIPFELVDQVQITDVFDKNNNMLPVSELAHKIATHAIFTGEDAVQINKLYGDKSASVTIKEIIDSIKNEYSFSKLYNPLTQGFFDYEKCMPFSLWQKVKACLKMKVF
ncbi:MAG: hypothetical protein PHX18_00090 [Candidatus Gastranaerophilales bacterium]|nr:hypothetical protein [Candidatus Gastranaerophilales bacterium]